MYFFALNHKKLHWMENATLSKWANDYHHSHSFKWAQTNLSTSALEKVQAMLSMLFLCCTCFQAFDKRRAQLVIHRVCHWYMHKIGPSIRTLHTPNVHTHVPLFKKRVTERRNTSHEQASGWRKKLLWKEVVQFHGTILVFTNMWALASSSKRGLKCTLWECIFEHEASG